MNSLARIESAKEGTIETSALAKLEQHAQAARGAYASNTERALRTDVATFTAWCAKARCAPLPASPETVAAFVDAMATSKAPATVRRYVSSVSTFHRAAGVANPCEVLTVKLALKRMHRERGRAQQQASPLTDQHVARMLAAAGASLRDLRDKALLVVAYTTMCRRTELVELFREDMQIEPDGFGTVTVRRSKTDQEGVGATAPITQDAMRHVLAWITMAQVEDGALFRAVLKGGRLGGALTAGEVGRIFKAMAARAGVPAVEITKISGHSTRVGAAQDAIRFGAELPAVMQAGRWKSAEMVSRYTQRLGARHGAAMLVAHKRVQF